MLFIKVLCRTDDETLKNALSEWLKANTCQSTDNNCKTIFFSNRGLLIKPIMMKRKQTT